MANRLSIIRAKTDISRWFYVPTKDNPADIVSRGLEADDGKNWDIFHNGPLFLRTSTWEMPEIPKEDAVAAMVGVVIDESAQSNQPLHPVLENTKH